MAFRTRSFQLAALAIAYVAFAAIAAAPEKAAGIAALVALPLLLALGWSRTAPPSRGEDHVEATARAAMRASLFGGALLVAARTAPAGHPAFDAAANLGAGIASVASLVALARIAPLGGLLTPPASARRLDGAGIAAVLWTVATAVPAARALAPTRTFRVDPLAIDYATFAAGLGSLSVTVAAAFRLRVQRKLELGVGDRAKAALALATAALAVALPATALGLAAPDRIVPLASVVASIAVAGTCVIADPTAVSRSQRTILAITVLGAPASLFGAAVALHAPHDAPTVVLVAFAVAVAIGLLSRELAKPLAPERSRWIDAIETASRAALRPEPDEASQAALTALREAAGPAERAPELWRISPPEVLTVDRAGYIHTESALAPGTLYGLAQGEPERTLRTEVLGALEVRRPDLRPLLAWMRDRGALSATLLSDAEGPIGFVMLPQGKRRAPLTLEEVIALRVLGDRLSALLEVSAALARSRARELGEAARADVEQDKAIHLEHLVDAEAGRHESAARRMARPARVATYSPGARLAVEELERLGALGIPVTLLAPLGVDPVAYAAIVHLASTRRGRPLVVVDAADAAEQPVDLWRSPDASPLALADGGTLVVLSAQALPVETQEHIARALAERRSPGGAAAPLDVALVVSVPATVDTLVASGRLSVALADRLGDRAVPLPPLSTRSEDLRALVIERLARIGVRLRGSPMGIEPRALAALVEHSWPGNDLELDDVLARAAQASAADVVDVEALDAIGFSTAKPQARRSASRPPEPGRAVASRRR